MPYVTPLPGVTFTGEPPSLSRADHIRLGEMGAAAEFGGYDVKDPEAGQILVSGDTTVLLDMSGAMLLSGTYGGAAELTGTPVSLPVTIGQQELGRVEIGMPALRGDLFTDDAGNTLLVTDMGIGEGQVPLTVKFDLAGIPISDVTETGARMVSAVETQLRGLDLPAATSDAILDSVGNLVSGFEQDADLVITSDPAARLVIPAAGAVACFASGTMIRTPQGEVQVEDIAVGELVVTRDRGPQPVCWVGTVTLDHDVLALSPHLRPIRIRAGALGVDCPMRDLLVSPQHRMLVRSRIAVKMFGAEEVLVAAKQLLRIEGVDYAEDLREVRYVHFLFDRHEIVFANGAESESLYTGPEALKSVGPAAREEIFTLFPELRASGALPQPVRMIPSNRMARKLAARHMQNRRRLVT